MAERFESVDAVLEALRRVDYLADPSTAGVVFLADRLEVVEGAKLEKLGVKTKILHLQ